jgi:hypothetical protein
MHSMAISLTPNQVADIIEAFLNGSSGDRDWDDFCSIRITDPTLDAIRVKCVDLHDQDPYPGQYCGPTGLQMMRGFMKVLRRESGGD